ncbi:MAG: excinuclease ABC subunit UvrA [Planctomycetota bacterium]
MATAADSAAASAVESAAAAPATQAIRIRGARTHNLRGVDVDLPRNKLVVITGVSGSGKSSLAFDTLLAEGQRQYIDSLSIYARQFFDQMQRPDVDRIEGLQPAIAIDQSQGSTNPRSTVGTVTEVYDYLRLLYARAGDLACAECGAAISQQSPEQIEQALGELAEGARVMLLAPLVRGKKGRHAEVMEQARKAGFVRVRIDGVTYPIEETPQLAAGMLHDIEAVIDRVVIREGLEARLAESVRLALKHGDGVLQAVYQTPEAKAASGSNGQNGSGGGSEYNAAHGWTERLFNTRYACPACGGGLAEVEPRTFSFNSPYGACPECDGLGVVHGFDPDRVLPDRSLSLATGVIAPWKGGTAAQTKRRHKQLTEFLAAEKLTEDQPLEAWPDGAVQRLVTGDGRGFLGLLMLLEAELATTRSEAAREKLEAFRGATLCPACGGARLRPEALGCTVGGLRIDEFCRMPVGDARRWIESVEFPIDKRPVAEPIVREVSRRLEFLELTGAHYLSLDRPADTLSGGELQRVRLATGIGAGLVGVMYLLDEPSIGLHPRDTDRLIQSLRGLQERGNTVIVVEHDEDVMREADWIIDVGPGSGSRGGTIVAEGTREQIEQNTDSLTGRYLSGAEQVSPPREPRRIAKSRSLRLEGATLNNLRDVSVEVPLGALVCVTGVSGSGKSSLVTGTLAPALANRLNGASRAVGPLRSLQGVAQLDRLVEVDQSPLGRSPRSNAATYTGLFDEVRKVFAKTKLSRARGYKAGRFSFNVKGGRCEECQGQGVRKIEMNFLPDLYVPCDACGGKRFNRQTLSVRLKGLSIADVLETPVDEARQVFADYPAPRAMLDALHEVGLGYLPIGQPSTTLSGGEAQRVKLAAELGAPRTGHTLYLLDEPTTGLHADDVRRLLGVLHKLVDAGSKVLVIEHHTAVMRSADWLIDLGPDGGAGGGQLVAAGTPEQLTAHPTSHTGRCLQGGHSWPASISAER